MEEHNHRNCFCDIYLSYDRDLPEEQVLDLFIALESLLSEDSEAISYKIALRASHLIESDPAKKEGIYYLVKDAYTERSHIIHGRQSSIE